MPAHPKARPASRTTEDQPADQIDFRKLYYTLRERIWVIALCLLIAGLGITAYLIRAPRIYVSRLVLQVEQGEQKILNIQRVQQEDPQSLEFLKTVEQTLQSRSLLERVLETNNLAGDPRFVKMDDGPRPTQEQLVTRLSRMVDAKLRKGTRLIDVKVEHTDPQIAALIAGSVYREFMSQNFEHTSSTADNAYSFLQNEEKRLKEQLKLDYTRANTLKIADGKLTGEVDGIIINADVKRDSLLQVRDKLQISKEQIIAIGDGANDVKFMAEAGVSVAYHAKPVVIQHATHAISHVGLDGVLQLFS